MDHKLTRIKRRLQLGRRAQLRRRVHHQCRPCQGSRQGPANGGRDGQGGTNSCVTLQDRRRSIHLKLETDEQGDHGRWTLIPVLHRAPGGPAGRWDRIPAPEFARIQIPATGNVPGSARIRGKTHGSQRGSERANSRKTPSKHRAKTPWMMEWVLFMTMTMTTTCPVLALPVL